MPRARYVTEREQQKFGVTRFQDGRDVLGNPRVISQIARCVEGKQFGGRLLHGSNSKVLTIRFELLRQAKGVHVASVSK